MVVSSKVVCTVPSNKRFALACSLFSLVVVSLGLGFWVDTRGRVSLFRADVQNFISNISNRLHHTTYRVCMVGSTHS